jgi:hypothetical protein
VYVLKPPTTTKGKYENMYKIGKTDDLDKRLNTYNTGTPDNMIVVHKLKTNDPIAVELCVKVISS